MIDLNRKEKEFLSTHLKLGRLQSNNTAIDFVIVCFCVRERCYICKKRTDTLKINLVCKCIYLLRADVNN